MYKLFSTLNHPKNYFISIMTTKLAKEIRLWKIDRLHLHIWNFQSNVQCIQVKHLLVREILEIQTRDLRAANAVLYQSSHSNTFREVVICNKPQFCLLHANNSVVLKRYFSTWSNIKTT